MMTSFVDESRQLEASLKDDGDLILVVDAEPEESGLPRITKLAHVTSLPTGARDDTLSSYECRRLVVLNRRAFDVSSSSELRLKRAAFSLSLDGLEIALKQELTAESRGISHQNVWPVHCMTSGYLSDEGGDEDGSGLDNEASRAEDAISTRRQYARGFLVALPPADVAEAAEVAVVAEDSATGDESRSGDKRSLSSMLCLRKRIDKIVDEHGFQVFLDSARSTGDSLWTVAGPLLDLATVRKPELTDVATSAARKWSLVELTGRELTMCSSLHPAFRERFNNLVFHKMEEVISALTETKVSHFNGRSNSLSFNRDDI